MESAAETVGGKYLPWYHLSPYLDFDHCALRSSDAVSLEIKFDWWLHLNYNMNI